MVLTGDLLLRDAEVLRSVARAGSTKDLGERASEGLVWFDVLLGVC